MLARGGNIGSGPDGIAVEDSDSRSRGSIGGVTLPVAKVELVAGDGLGESLDREVVDEDCMARLEAELESGLRGNSFLWAEELRRRR